MLYRVLKRMIERGQTAGMGEKLDVFYAANKLTTDEYTELSEMLKECYRCPKTATPRTARYTQVQGPEERTRVLPARPTTK